MSRLTNDIEAINRALMQTVTQLASRYPDPPGRRGHDVILSLPSTLGASTVLPLMA